MRCLRVLSLSLVLFVPLLAQAVTFGGPFSLTNTRYGTVPGEARLVSNGSTLFLFWVSGTVIRVTEMAEGVNRVGRPVMSTTESSAHGFDVIWTGSHFYLVATASDGLRARMLDHNGTPVGDEYLLRGGSHLPRLAFNGTTILLAHYQGGVPSIGTLPISKSGEPGTNLSASTIAGLSHAVATNGDGFAVATAGFDGISVTLFDRNALRLEQVSILAAPMPNTRVTIASDGSNYLATWLHDEDGGFATIVRPSGSFTAPTRLLTDTGSWFEAPASTWSGSDYLLTFVRKPSASTPALSLLHLNREGSLTGAEPDQQLPTSGSTSSFARLGGRTFLAYNRAEHATLAELPLSQGDTAATFGAGSQRVLATASLPSGTLVVWTESLNGSVFTRMGVRDANGNWSERLLLAERVTRAVAATDGTRFLVTIADDNQASIAYRVDANGVPGAAIPLAFEVTDATWNGKEFVLIGEQRAENGWQSNIVASKMTTFGDPGPIVTIRSLSEGVAPDEPSIASRGGDLLAVWRATDNPFCPFPCIVSTGIEGTRLDENLVRLDAHDLSIGTRDSNITQPAVIWNGVEYLVVWDNYVAMWSASITAGGTVTARVLESRNVHVHSPRMVRLANGLTAVAWADTGTGLFGTPSTSPRHRILFTRTDGTIADADWIEDGASPDFLLAPLGGDALGYLTSPAWLDAPHHGASRVTMQIARRSAPPNAPPTPPSVTAKWVDGRALVSWTHGEIVNGYRIEYRVTDGSWNEVQAWYGSDERSASLNMPEHTAFRMRAFSDAGVSAPSAPTPQIAAPAPRRRAVR